MENHYFITGEATELVASTSTSVAQWGKLGDWKNGYGKYTVAIILLYAIYDIFDTGFPMITSGNSADSFFVYARYALLFYIAFQIYRGSFQDGKNLLVINSRGILYRDETFSWNDLLNFQLSLEKEKNKRYHVYYLHLQTKNMLRHKINISVYGKNVNEILHALRQNTGKNEVQDLGFTQIV